MKGSDMVKQYADGQIIFKINVDIFKARTRVVLEMPTEEQYQAIVREFTSRLIEAAAKKEEEGQR